MTTRIGTTVGVHDGTYPSSTRGAGPKASAVRTVSLELVSHKQTREHTHIGQIPGMVIVQRRGYSGVPTALLEVLTADER